MKAPKTLWMATYHVHFVNRGKVIIDSDHIRVGSLKYLKLSIKNTRDMTMTKLKFYKYIRQ